MLKYYLVGIREKQNISHRSTAPKEWQTQHFWITEQITLPLCKLS